VTGPCQVSTCDGVRRSVGTRLQLNALIGPCRRQSRAAPAPGGVSTALTARPPPPSPAKACEARGHRPVQRFLQNIDPRRATAHFPAPTIEGRKWRVGAASADLAGKGLQDLIFAPAGYFAAMEGGDLGAGFVTQSALNPTPEAVLEDYAHGVTLVASTAR
jgi:hypothetical protein